MYVRSSDTDRNLMSAQCNLAALFPPNGDQIWDNTLNWQPIPIHTVPLSGDYLVYQSIPCAKSDKEHDLYLESDEIKEKMKKYSELFKYIHDNSRVKIDKPGDFHLLYEALSVEHAQGYP